MDESMEVDTSEQHVLAEPPNDEAYYRAQALILNRLSEWLCDERGKVKPSSQRWRTLADVTAALHELAEREVHPVASSSAERDAEKEG